MKTADLHLLSATCHDGADFEVPVQVPRTGIDSDSLGPEFMRQG
jgi:hypothetical protein